MSVLRRDSTLPSQEWLHIGSYASIALFRIAQRGLFENGGRIEKLESIEIKGALKRSTNAHTSIESPAHGLYQPSLCPYLLGIFRCKLYV